MKDINPGSSHSGPSSLTVFGGKLFFSANHGTSSSGLWKSDGTAAGTVLVKDISSPVELTVLGGELFFRAYGTNGAELWKSDGTAAGTVLVKDIYPGSFNGFPSRLTEFGGELFFSANDGTNGYELWKSDGTAAGTVLVKDIYPGTFHSFPDELTEFGVGLFFSANDGTNGTELWAVLPNDPPTITVTEPDGIGDTIGASFLIQWSDENLGDDAAISLYYDSDNLGEDGTLITGGLSEDPDGAGNDDFTWDITGVPDGDYYIYAVIDDGVNPQVVDYSAGPVTVARTVDFTAASQSNPESVSPVTVTARLSAPSGVGVDVPVTFGGTAADPADYNPSSATITIPAGVLSADLTLSVVGDALDEDDETVVVTMGVPTNAMAGTVTVHSATLEDDDAPPTVSFTGPAQSNAESVTGVTVTAQLSALSGREVRLPLTFAGDAGDPGDYSPSTSTLVIPAGQMSADLTLTVVDDALDEGNEIVDVQMGTPVNAGLGATTVHTAVIQDDDPAPAVDFTASFQSNFENVTPVTVTAQLSVLSGKEVQVPVSFGGTAVDPDDYSPSGSTITIPAGQMSADLTLTVVDDALDEGSELIDVAMGVPVNATPGTTTVHTVLIQDNDAPPVVDFTSAAQSNAESVSPVTVTAQLSAVSGQAVQVPVAFGGDAADPGDYSPSTATITVPAGQTSSDLTLAVVDDSNNENDETVVVTMGMPVNARTTPWSTSSTTPTIAGQTVPSSPPSAKTRTAPATSTCGTPPWWATAPTSSTR